MTIGAIANTTFTPTRFRPRGFMSQELRVGQVLMSDVMTKDGTKIFTAGTRITSDLLAKLKSFASVNGIKEPILAEG